MPAALVADFAKRSGKPRAEVERLWDKSKGIVKDQYNLDEPKGGAAATKYWKLVVGILKKMLKLESEEADENRLAEMTGGHYTFKKDGKQVVLTNSSGEVGRFMLLARTGEVVFAPAAKTWFSKEDLTKLRHEFDDVAADVKKAGGDE